MASSSALRIPHCVSNLRVLLDNNPANQSVRRPCSLTIRNPKGRRESVKMAAATASFSNKLEPLRSCGKSATVAGEKLDEWMRESVVDIVKNLREAPLLVQVFKEDAKNKEKGGAAARMETEKAVAEEDWLAKKGKWESGEAPLPQGVIFVEELGEEEEEGERSSESESTTRAWGIVVQGRGAECGPACYLLKTSRVRALGSLCSTHFCLVRVKGFRETAASQLKNCWLLQRLTSEGY
ncbi:uncharacterized protein LOC132186495 [Corylus avellana]|uniref:uncharacterized protein LOC132186495 n=1 Tax=Corylus avellana TaxID=13451 RepID=UPI001E1F3B93|nr:uncharacterized protein LOC132186495 [Corylus avellana]